MIVTIHHDAADELVDGARYYAQHATRELANKFLDEFDRTIELLRKYPRLGMPWRNSTRKLPLRRFPYDVVYRISAEDMLIVAVAHQSRRPDSWRNRVDPKA